MQAQIDRNFPRFHAHTSRIAFSIRHFISIPFCMFMLHVIQHHVIQSPWKIV